MRISSLNMQDTKIYEAELDSSEKISLISYVIK